MGRFAVLRPRRTHLAGVMLASLLVASGPFTIGAELRGQFPTGSIRLSSGFNTKSIQIFGTEGPDSFKRALRTWFVVPSGKRADIQATFTAALHPLKFSGTYAYCFGRFTLDGATSDANFRPGQVQLIGGPHATMPSAISVAMTGFRQGIGPGTHYVNVYISSAYQGCELQERALNVVVNLR